MLDKSKIRSKLNAIRGVAMSRSRIITSTLETVTFEFGMQQMCILLTVDYERKESCYEFVNLDNFLTLVSWMQPPRISKFISKVEKPNPDYDFTHLVDKAINDAIQHGGSCPVKVKIKNSVSKKLLARFKVPTQYSNRKTVTSIPLECMSKDVLYDPDHEEKEIAHSGNSARALFRPAKPRVSSPESRIFPGEGVDSIQLNSDILYDR